MAASPLEGSNRPEEEANTNTAGFARAPPAAINLQQAGKE